MSNMKKVLEVASKDKLGALTSPCTVAEALQIASSVAEDYLGSYIKSRAHVDLYLAIQVDVLKSLLFKSDLLNEQEFIHLCDEKLKEVQNNMKGTTMQEPDPKMEVKVGEVEVEKVKEE